MKVLDKRSNPLLYFLPLSSHILLGKLHTAYVTSQPICNELLTIPRPFTLKALLLQCLAHYLVISVRLYRASATVVTEQTGLS